MRDWILPAIGTFFFWGLYGFIPKFTVRHISPMSAIVYSALGGIPIALLALFLLNFRLESHPRGILLALITGAIGTHGALGFIMAVSKGQVSLVVTFTALYPTLTVLLAVLFLHESLTLRQGVGIVMALIAMVLVAA